MYLVGGPTATKAATTTYTTRTATTTSSYYDHIKETPHNAAMNNINEPEPAHNINSIKINELVIPFGIRLSVIPFRLFIRLVM